MICFASQLEVVGVGDPYDGHIGVVWGEPEGGERRGWSHIKLELEQEKISRLATALLGRVCHPPVRIRHVKLHKVLLHQPIGMGWIGRLVLHYALNLMVVTRRAPIIGSCCHIAPTFHGHSIWMSGDSEVVGPLVHCHGQQDVAMARCISRGIGVALLLISAGSVLLLGGDQCSSPSTAGMCQSLPQES